MKIDSFRELCRDGKVNCETCLFRMRLSDSSHGECHYYPPRPIVYERTDRRLDLTDFENDLEGVPHELLRTDEEDQWEYSLAAWQKLTVLDIAGTGKPT
jgi:hypothetical protein